MEAAWSATKLEADASETNFSATSEGPAVFRDFERACRNDGLHNGDVAYLVHCVRPIIGARVPHAAVGERLARHSTRSHPR